MTSSTKMESIFSKNFVNPTEKLLRQCLCLIKIQALRSAASLKLKRDPNTGAFLLKLPKLTGAPFFNYFFYRTSLVAAS